ncbi:MAG: hypothetical protein J4473_05805 [Candidatus Aenigmarchaeota archaeon]|nr:hypothetical protein [Candidatus Aenigmarchaeota archaeon]
MHKLLDDISPDSLKDYTNYIRVKRKYRYFCSSCRRNFESAEEVNACKRCGRVTIHMTYPWSLEKKRDMVMKSLIKLPELHINIPKFHFHRKPARSEEEMPTF